MGGKREVGVGKGNEKQKRVDHEKGKDVRGEGLRRRKGEEGYEGRNEGVVQWRRGVRWLRREMWEKEE